MMTMPVQRSYVAANRLRVGLTYTFAIFVVFS